MWWPGLFGQTKLRERWCILRHAVLATDYESYALIHACKEHYDEATDNFSKLVYDQIWSRTPHMDKALLHTLKSVMSSIDIEDDEWQDVTNDAC
ncbi:hypothetical protein C0J52_03499 [Blattella germanica]|nr:hypothetical protein C0J52_03499 [Blattella germanica]